MEALIRLYQLLLVTAAVVVVGGCLVSFTAAAHLVILAIPIVLLIVFTVLTVEFTPDAESRGELESLIGLKRGGVFLRHAARIGPRRTRPAAPRSSTPSDTPLDHLVRAKRDVFPGRGA
jgi:hypothetical protein